MKIAVPVKGNNQIDEHFGHCEFYKIFTVSAENKVLSVDKMDSPEGCGCKSDIASVFEKEGIKVMLAGGIGNGAVNILVTHGVEVVRNCSGDVSELVEQYLAGKVQDSGSNCSGHGDDHECTNH